MGEIITSLIIIVLMLIAICFIGSLVLVKNTKEFHIHFGLLKGFDISGSFFDSNNPQENQQ